MTIKRSREWIAEADKDDLAVIVGDDGDVDVEFLPRRAGEPEGGGQEHVAGYASLRIDPDSDDVDPGDPAEAERIDRGHRKSRQKSVLVRILRARARMKFGFPTNTKANWHAVREYVSRQSDIIRAWDAADQVRIIDHQVMPWVFVVPESKLIDHLAVHWNWNFFGWRNEIYERMQRWHSVLASG